MTHCFNDIIIAGAGPSGLLCALLLAQKGIPVTVLEATDTINDSPRALGYGPPAVQVLRRAGILDKVRELGVEMRHVSWRKVNGERIAGVRNSNLENPDRYAVLPINLLSQILVDELVSWPSASIKWKHRIIAAGQVEDNAWVDVDTPEGVKRLTTDYLIGCDGANSVIRQSLYGRNFPGHTWDGQLVATNLYYDLDQFGWDDTQFIVHPEHNCVIARITKDGLWRVSYAERGDLTVEEVKKRLPDKMEVLLPGSPKPDQYRLTNVNPYRMHQRCVDRMRVGRILLAADAAHLCTPYGGLGLTGGISDIGSLADCLLGMYDGKATSEILDKYDEVRREKYHSFIDPSSSSNLRRVRSDGDTILDTDPFLQKLLDLEQDPTTTVGLQASELELVGDMTQYFIQVNGKV